MIKRILWTRVLLVLLTIVACYILGMHFLITFLYLSPINPISANMQGTIKNYTQDLFAQNWSLFAPDPLHNNTALLVQCIDENENESSWYNINYGMIESMHKEPLGPFVRLSRMHLAAIRYYQGYSEPTTELTRQRICLNDPSNSICTREDDSSIRFKEAGQTMFTRLGSAACTQLNTQADLKIIQVKLRVLTASVRPFSERNNNQWTPSISGFETEKFPFEEVAPLPVKLVKGGGEG